MIKGIVKGRALSIFGIDGDRLTAGSVGLKIQFTFDDEWSGLSKTVVFQNGSILRSATVQDDECTVPFEVMVNPGSKLRIGIRGVDGSSTVIPTIYADILIYQGTVEASSPGGQYTPSDIEQIQGEIGDLSELQTSVKTSLVGAINSLSGQALSEELKLALLQLASKVAYIDEDGQDYYDDLYNALYRAAELVSISAVFTPGENIIYTNDSLDVLKQYLIVTALYDDGASEVVTAYTLSGILSEGISVISVTYANKTTTFNVVSVVNGWMYHFNQSILSSGTEEFGFVGNEVYAVGRLGTDYAYSHIVPTLDDASSDTQMGLKAINISKFPNFGGDYTLSYWAKCQKSTSGHAFWATKYNSSAGNTRYYNTTPIYVDSNWSVSLNGQNGAANSGFAIQIYQGHIHLRISNSNLSKTNTFELIPPSGFDFTQWHHYAMTRKGITVRVFIDGTLIAAVTANDNTCYNPGQIAISAYFNNTSGTVTSDIQKTGWGELVQDLYIAEFCKWEESFDPQSILY